MVDVITTILEIAKRVICIRTHRILGVVITFDGNNAFISDSWQLIVKKLRIKDV